MKYLKKYEVLVTDSEKDSLKKYEVLVTDSEKDSLIGKQFIFVTNNDEFEEFFDFLVKLKTEPKAFIIPKEFKDLLIYKDVLILFKYQPDVPSYIMNRSYEAWKMNRHTLSKFTQEEITDVDLYSTTNKYNV